MAHLLIDIGNTSTKVAVSRNGRLCHRQKCTELTDEILKPLLDGYDISCVGVSVVGDASRLVGLPVSLPCLRVSSGIKLPFTIAYDSPQTLGADRLAASVAAYALGGGGACLVIDAGTCITIDYIDGGACYRGGAILPGMDMKFRALHNFTANLPLLDIETLSEASDMPSSVSILGGSTRDSIRVGVIDATVLALQGFLDRYKAMEPSLRLFLTGGAAPWLENALDTEVCLEPDLVLIGIDKCLEDNCKF